MKGIKLILFNFLNTINPIFFFVLKNKSHSKIKCALLYFKYFNNRFTIERKSNSIAILGSGRTINEIDNQQLNYLSKNDSLALNQWIIHHDFVPTFYMYEGTKNENEIHMDIINSFNLKKENYKSVVLLFKFTEWFLKKGNLIDDLTKFDAILWKNILFYRIKLLNKRMFFKKKYQLNKRDKGPFLQARSSIATAIAFSYAQGYNEIVLFGFDLHGGYFWQEEKDSNNVIHNTEKDIPENLKISEIIAHYNNYLNFKGVKIYVSSANSRLYPQIEKYEF